MTIRIVTHRFLQRVGREKWAIRDNSKRRIHSRLPSVPVVSKDIEPGDIADATETIRQSFATQEPVLLRRAVLNADAITKWNTWDHLEQSVPSDTIVHVEIGGSYNGAGQRSDIRFADYILYLRFFEEQYGKGGDALPPPENLVYLAQNDIPEKLLDDFEIPPFCSCVGEGRRYSTMVWIGPYGCVSPLHFDPLDNALMQFVGSKRVILLPPSTVVYAGEDGNQSNTSPIDPESALDLDKYPLLADIPLSMECILHPGDVLYIPKRWWHHVRTLETSVSVNCWWR